MWGWPPFYPYPMQGASHLGPFVGEPGVLRTVVHIDAEGLVSEMGRRRVSMETCGDQLPLGKASTEVHPARAQLLTESRCPSPLSNPRGFSCCSSFSSRDVSPSQPSVDARTWASGWSSAGETGKVKGCTA